MLDRDSGHPLHRQLADQLRSDVLAGRLPPGQRLPAERELQAHYGASRDVIRKALDLLRAEGWLETRRGSGTYVRELPPTTTIDLPLTVDQDQRGLFLYRHAQGWGLLFPTLIERELPPPDIGRRLGLDLGEQAVKRDRVIGPEGGPVGQLATTWLPDWLTIPYPRLAEVNTGPTGFLGLLEAAQYRLRFTVTVATRMPLSYEASLLGLGQGQPVLRLLRTSYDATTDTALEVTDYRLPGDRYEVTIPVPDRRPQAPEDAPETDLAD